MVKFQSDSISSNTIKFSLRGLDQILTRTNLIEFGQFFYRTNFIKCKQI